MANFVRLTYYLLSALRRVSWNKERLREYQNRRLRAVVRNAYHNVPFYHRLYKEAGVEPSDIMTVDDLKKLPIVDKTTLKRTPISDLVSNQYNPRDLKTISTGGSTGQPFSICVNSREDAWRKSVYMRANISCGQRPRDRWIALVEADQAKETTGLQKRFGIFAQNIIPVASDREAQLRILEHSRPDILDGFSGMLWLIAKEMDHRGMNQLHPKIIFGTGELFPESSRRYVERVFGGPYHDQFGCTEMDRTAWQCPLQEGYHMDTDSAYMQFVDDCGEEIAIGEEGEIVYTSLYAYAMPFIRYNVKDVGVPISDECSCGRRLPLMKVLEGRSNSFLVLPNDRLVAPMSFIEALQAFNFVKEIDRYKVVQNKKDSISILVKKTSKDVDEKGLANALLSNIRVGLPKMAGVDISEVNLEVKFVDDIPLTARGKLNVVVSNVRPRS